MIVFIGCWPRKPGSFRALWGLTYPAVRWLCTAMLLRWLFWLKNHFCVPGKGRVADVACSTCSLSPLRVVVKRGGVKEERWRKERRERERELGTALPLLTFCRILCNQPMGERGLEKNICWWSCCKEDKRMLSYLLLFQVGSHCVCLFSYLWEKHFVVSLTHPAFQWVKQLIGVRHQFVKCGCYCDCAEKWLDFKLFAWSPFPPFDSRGCDCSFWMLLLPVYLLS